MVSAGGRYYSGDALDYVLQGNRVLVTCGTISEAEGCWNDMIQHLRRTSKPHDYRPTIRDHKIQMSIEAGAGEATFATRLRQGASPLWGIGYDVTYITDYALDLIWKDLFDRIGPAAIAMKDGPPYGTR